MPSILIRKQMYILSALSLVMLVLEKFANRTRFCMKKNL